MSDARARRAALAARRALRRLATPARQRRPPPATCGPTDGRPGRRVAHATATTYANTRHQDREKVISPGDAPTLRRRGRSRPSTAGGDGDITGTPVVADGCVYVGHEPRLGVRAQRRHRRARVEGAGALRRRHQQLGRASRAGACTWRVAHVAAHGLPDRRPVRRALRGRVRPGDRRARVGDRSRSTSSRAPTSTAARWSSTACC